ncbi:MAG TPA: chemotaxis protein CheW [Spirochaetota bacterium]|nr:chemotaxis protein CheW [Spirochaetota bacterium]HPS85569.1 chemotaxis protein CheW [Spirochaetota bacterium]
MEEIIRTDEDYVLNIDPESEMTVSADGDLVLYLTFLLGKDLFGIQVSEIREVIEYKQVFKLPRVPEFLKGVINLRGEVVPIIDLHSRFYNTSFKVTSTTSIVVVEVDDDNHKTPIGVIIDSVKAVTELYESNIEAVPEIGSRIRPDFVEGIGKLDDQFVILLRVQNILNIEELSNIDGNFQ